jgi:O-succinylbenzoate synthase
MRIDAVEVYHVAMPLAVPWTTAYGSDAEIESVLVRMSSGAHSAWAESCPLGKPEYSAEYAAGVYQLVATQLVDCVLGKQVGSGEELQALLAHFKGNPFAKAALDNAWWALQSVVTQTPLYQLVGGVSPEIEVGEALGLGQWDGGKGVDELIGKVGKAFEVGFSRVKLKFVRESGLAMLRAVRARFPTQTFHVDMNSGLSLAEDRELLLALDEFGLAFLEQPLSNDDVADHAALARLVATPVCLDESLNSVDRARQAIEQGACTLFNIKPARCGGLTPSLQIAALAREHGVPCWIGGMLESGIGLEFQCALATLDVCQRPAAEGGYPHDINPDPSGGWATRNLCAGERGQRAADMLRFEPGKGVFITATTAPHSAAPDPEMLEACTVSHFAKSATPSAL